jgi:hypothetical protein
LLETAGETASGASRTPSIDCGGVLSADPTLKLPQPSRTKTFIFILFVLALAVFVGVRFSESLQGTDFPDFYCAARMLAEGHGHQLYDPDVQRQYQARYSGRVGTLYIHPPFEAPLYLAVSWLPLRRAYALWFVLNLAFLAISLRSLAKEALPPWDWRLLLAASLTFVPVLLCLQQGQDSLLLLLFVVLAFIALRRKRAFAAGCWLALGLFKFQIVLPLALVVVLTQNRSVTNKRLQPGSADSGGTIGSHLRMVRLQRLSKISAAVAVTALRRNHSPGYGELPRTDLLLLSQ